MIRNLIGHLKTVYTHKKYVFYLSCKVGIPIQGILHDMSKFSPTEFFESVKYYKGIYSPITNCISIKGYSNAWLHHKKYNKHHYEYWLENNKTTELPVMPFKYFLELLCDTLSAGLTYQKDNWTKDYQLRYFIKTKDKYPMNEKQKNLLLRIYKDISIYGIDKVLDKENLKILYDLYINNEYNNQTDYFVNIDLNTSEIYE